MSGKRQHHIWRHLQNGFGEKRRNHYQVWVYEKDSEPRPKSTNNIGVEKFYYGPEDSDADRFITSKENVLQELIYTSRDAPDGLVLDFSGSRGSCASS